MQEFTTIDPQAHRLYGQFPYSYCVNSPMNYIDPDGEFPWLIGALVGGILNWAFNGFQFNAEGLGYFATGAVAGAVGAGVGAGVSSVMAGGGFGAGFAGTAAAQSVASSAISGMAIGAAGGASGGFLTGFGNSLVQQQGFGQAFGSAALGGLMGGIGGGIIGGLYGGIDAAIDGRHFWYGDRLTTDISTPLPQMNQIGEADCRYETFRSMDSYYNGETSSVSDLRASFPNAERSEYQLGRMYRSQRMALYNLKNEITDNMTKAEIAQKMANSMEQNKAIHYEFKFSNGGHAVGISRVRIYDSGRILLNYMNPSGAGGYSTTNFNKMLNMFSVFKY